MSAVDLLQPLPSTGAPKEPESDGWVTGVMLGGALGFSLASCLFRQWYRERKRWRDRLEFRAQWLRRS